MNLPEETDNYIRESIEDTIGLPISTRTLQLKLRASDEARHHLHNQCLHLRSKLKEKDEIIDRARAEASINAQALRKFVDENQKLAEECANLLAQCKRWEKECSLYDGDREALMEFGNEADERAKEAEIPVLKLEEEMGLLSKELEFYKSQYEAESAEELASLIRDNLPSKHLVLSVEEAMVTLLQDETSSNGMLELEPMNPYNRLLIHRLADIFGFSHQSVGEGEERHIILQRCPDTSMPSVLVSDLLWEYDDLQYERFSDVPEKPSEEFRGVNSERGIVSFEDRQAAYLVARQRIFSADEYDSGETVKQRPPKNPVVARRMIAHALGQQAKPSSEKDILRDRELEESDSHEKIQGVKEKASNLSTENHLSLRLKQQARIDNGSSQSDMRLPVQKVVKPSTKLDPPHTERSDEAIQKERNEQVGAARRIFANALGFQPRNGNALKSSLKKETVE